MRRIPVVPVLLVALLLLGSSGCTDIQARYDDALDTAGEMSDRVRFCLSLARAVTAIESGSPDTAQDAIEEAVAQAPEDLRDDVRTLADSIRAAQDEGSDGLRNADLRAAAEDLRDRTRDLCDPT